MAAYTKTIEAGPPTSGFYQVGDTCTDVNDTVWQCVFAGAPGLWAQMTVVKEVVTGGWQPTLIDGPIFTANRAFKVKNIIVRVAQIGSDAGAVTLVIKKAPSGTAPSAGTALHTGSVDLKAGANNNQTLTLSATPADLLLAAGDSICFDLTGVLTAAFGNVSIEIEQRS